jgi:hypothetical protein
VAYLPVRGGRRGRREGKRERMGKGGRKRARSAREGEEQVVVEQYRRRGYHLKT